MADVFSQRQIEAAMNKGCAAFVVLFVVMTPLVSTAAPVTFHFEGKVTFVNALLNGTFDKTQTISGSYTFDSAAPDLVGNSTTTGVYAVSSASLTLGAYSAAHDETFLDILLRIRDDAPIQILSNGICCDLVPLDEYELDVDFAGAGPSAGGFPLDTFTLRLSDLITHTGIDSDDLPVTPPDLSDFIPINRFWQLSFQGGPTNVVAVGGEITSLTVETQATPVPEPATLGLVGAGLLQSIRRVRKTRKDGRRAASRP